MVISAMYSKEACNNSRKKCAQIYGNVGKCLEPSQTALVFYTSYITYAMHCNAMQLDGSLRFD